MKRNLLLLAVMIWVAFGFSLAQAAQDPNDNGAADTLYLESWPDDEGLFWPPPWDVKIAAYITNDIPDPDIDSIAGIVIPLCYTSSNAAANATIDIAKNNTNLYPFPDLDNSIFQHLPDMATRTVENWMMLYSEELMGTDWDTKILDLGTGDHFWLSLVPTGTADRRFWGGSRQLTATITFTIEDSTVICLDSCFWPPTGRLAFSRSDAVTYIPQIWDDYQGTEWYCDTFYIVPNQFPEVTCPGDRGSFTFNMNGHYELEYVIAIDYDGVIVDVSAVFAGSGVANVTLTGGTTGDSTYQATLEFDVVNHCEAGGTITVTALDDAGGDGECTVDIILENNPPVCTEPDDWTGSYSETMVSTDFTCEDEDGDPTTMTIVGVTPAPCCGGPVIVDNHVEWVGCCCMVCIEYIITLECMDICGATAPPQIFTVHFTNDPPVATCPDNAVVTAGSKFVSTEFDVQDPDGGHFSKTITIDPPSVNPVVFVHDPVSHFEWQTDASEEGTYTICVTVFDECDATDSCCFEVEVVSYGFSNIFIPNTDCVNPGEYVCLPILLDNNTTPFGGFELAVDFDYTAMTFVGAEPCEAIEGFEKFTYRLLPCPACPCCKYKIFLYGQYDLPNGVGNIGDPIPMTPQGVYQCLVELCFVVNNDENLRGFKIPVCWEWEGTIGEQGCLVEDWNCGENTFSSWSGDTLYTSMLCCQFVADLCDDPSDRVDGKLIFQWGVCGQNCGGVDVCAAG
ncbi:MAG: hypothetical protein JSV10_10760, partial [Candidatus Zixiibacteriota bacterium]